MRNRLTAALTPLLASVTMIGMAPVHAQSDAGYDFNLEAQSLDSSLQSLARTVGKEIIYSLDAVANRRAAPLKGHYSLDAALSAVLRGSGLIAQYQKDTIVIHRAGKGSQRDSDLPNDADIVVTGSHIRGAEPITPVRTATKASIERRGFNDLGSFIRDLPQNYSGGQNPGIAGGGQGGSENVTSSSALNLRGLGQDATLTLFNGHRVAYDAVGQGVDITAIPLAAIDRVEIVSDGSSALYGSDAVGGVANVILRRDFKGAEISARFGAATDGGDEEQQYNLVTGHRWNSGGIMAAFDYRYSTPITAGQRSYTQTIFPTSTMLNRQEQYSLVAAGHQSLTDALELAFDGHLSDRKNNFCITFSATADCFVLGADATTRTRAWSISPSLTWKAGGDWSVRLGGTASESKADNSTNAYVGAVQLQQGRAIYTNRLKSLELAADGPLFQLPGGPARVAIGGGIRNAEFEANGVLTSGGAAVPIFVFTVSRDTYYGYGEVSLPLIGADMAIPFVDRLILTGAVRYEDTPRIGRLATPKFGLLYAPSPDIAFKASWGKSFKAPTLFQTGQAKAGYSGLGSRYLPPSPTPGTVLLLNGGNPDLTPERATSWNATLTLTPRFAEGLRIDLSYFNVKYRGRVVFPIPSNSTAFAPQYSEFVTLNPTRAQIAAALANLAGPVQDQGGGNIDTANVVAIVANNLQNAARQSISGVDFTADYKFDLGADSRMHVAASASYLESEQQLSSSQPVVQLAGTIFRPPHWRANANLGWERGNVSLDGAFSYIGGSFDNRLAPFFRVGSYKSVDLVARVRTDREQGPLGGMTFTLAALNLLNEKPAFARTTSASGYQYDSTNFPSIGRFLSLTVTKSF